MKPTSFVKYTEGRRRPGAVVLAKLSRMGVNVNWLLTANGPMLLSGPPPGTERTPPGESGDEARRRTADDEIDSSDDRFHRIPVLAVREDADRGPQLSETGVEEWLGERFIRAEYGVDPALLRTLRVTGNSMSDTLRAGERVRAVLQEVQSLTDGAVYLLRTAEAFLFRRILRQKDGFLLEADHPDAEDRPISPNVLESEYTPVARMLEVFRAL